MFPRPPKSTLFPYTTLFRSTSITEVYQSGPTVAPVVNGWGCEVGATQATKYVAGIGTSVDRKVTGLNYSHGSSANGSLVTLIPMATSAAAAVFTTGNSASLY